MELFDLRSDTVTKPTDEMREAMSTAIVGDDVYGEDPTVNSLQEMAAEKMGKEAGLFVASGTMGNLIAILAHCGRGDEVIVGNKAHTFLYEAGGASSLGGVHSCQLSNQPDGSIRLEDIEAAIRPDDPHEPVSRLICLENSHNRCGGTVQSVKYIHEAAQLAHSHGISLHLDGARIFNAAVALGVEVKALADPADSIMFCLSKGLCAPVGSILCGSNLLINKAHRIRKMLGGGMRQAGIIAAAGIVAMERMIPRLKDDHIRAKTLANGLKNIPGLKVNNPITNMIFLSIESSIPLSLDQIIDKLRKEGILVGDTGPRDLRLVLHYWIDDHGVETAIQAFRNVFLSFNS